jgi:dTDP-4-dehydrorhamnose reductase
MKVLVFGKTGQVATELSCYEGTTCLSRDMADLSNPLACAAIISKTDADIIINAAAYTAVDKAEKDESLATIINGTTVSEMAKAAAKRTIPFLHISTDYVFDGSGEQQKHPSDAAAPLGIYGRSKLLGEQGVTAAAGSHAILRTSWVFSAHGNNFVKTMLRLGKDRTELSVVNDQIGGPTSANDIAAALMRIASVFYAGNGRSGIYHFAGAPATSWAGFAEEIFKQANLSVNVKGIPATEYPTPAKRPYNSRMDCTDTMTAFGISPPNWRTSLANVLLELNRL